MKNKQTQQRRKADRFHLSVLAMSPIVLHHCGSAKEGAPKTKKDKNPNRKANKKPAEAGFFNDNWKVVDRNK